MVHQFIQIYLKIGVFFVQTVLSTVIRIDRPGSDCAFFPIRPVCHLRQYRVGPVRIYIQASLLRLLVGQPFHWYFHENLHKYSFLCGFLLRFAGLQHHGGERLRQINLRIYFCTVSTVPWPPCRGQRRQPPGLSNGIAEKIPSGFGSRCNPCRISPGASSLLSMMRGTCWWDILSGRVKTTRTYELAGGHSRVFRLCFLERFRYPCMHRRQCAGQKSAWGQGIEQSN